MSPKEYEQYDDDHQHDQRRKEKRRSIPRSTKNTRSSREKEPAERQQHRQSQRQQHHNDHAERMHRSLPNIDFSKDYDRSRNHRRHDNLGEHHRRGKSEQGHRRPSINSRREDTRREDTRREDGLRRNSMTSRLEERVSADRIRRVPKKNPSSRLLSPDDSREHRHLSRQHYSEQRLRADDRHPRVEERAKLARSRSSKPARRFSAGDDTRQRSTRRLPEDALRREETGQLLEKSRSTRRSSLPGRKQPQRHHKEYILKTDKELSIFLQGCFEKEFSDCSKTDAETIAYLQRCFEEEFYERKKFYERHSPSKDSKSDEEIARELEVLFEKEFKRYMDRHGQAIESSRQRRHQETSDEVFAQYLQKAFEQEFVRQVKQNIERRESLAREFEAEPKREFEAEPRGGSRILGGERRLKKDPQHQQQSRCHSSITKDIRLQR